MPYMKERAGATYQDEILRNVSGGEIAENSVVDGLSIPLNGDGRRMLLTGTVMVWEGAPGSSKVKPIATTAPAVGTDETQTITRSAAPDAGGFSLTIPGYGTTAVVTAYTAGALQTAIQAVSGLSDATVGLVGQVYTITVPDRNIEPITVASNTLTASAVPVTLTVATTGEGAVSGGDIAGIVMHTTEFWPGTTEANKDDASVALWTKNCHFYAAKLIGYTNNATVIKTAMQGGGNGRCANCSFG